MLVVELLSIKMIMLEWNLYDRVETRSCGLLIVCLANSESLLFNVAPA
jgi:hypothetical protein